MPSVLIPVRRGAWDIGASPASLSGSPSKLDLTPTALVTVRIGYHIEVNDLAAVRPTEGEPLLPYDVRQGVAPPLGPKRQRRQFLASLRR